MELPQAKRHEYPVLLLLAVLCGSLCPALSAILSNASQAGLLHAAVPAGVWYLLDILAECWAGALIFAALRFPPGRCVPLLLMPVLAVVVSGAALAVTAPRAEGLRATLLLAAVGEAAAFCCWLLLAILAKPLARHVPHELAAAALLLLLGSVLVFAVNFALGLAAYLQEVHSPQGATAIFISPRAWALGYLKNGWKALRAFAAAFLTYALLWGIFERGLFSRIGRLLRRAWGATAA